MVKKINKYLMIVLVLSSYSWGALTSLTKSIVAPTSFDTAPNLWSGPPDDGNLAVNIGFNFPLGGSSFSTLYIQTNGAITFSSTTISYTNGTQFYDNNYLYPYWDDMNPRVGGSIRYGLLDAGLSTERFVVSWLGTPHYNFGGSYTFQAVLYKNGTIRFRYDSTSDTSGSSATIGIDISSTNYDAHSKNNSATFDATKDILYSPDTANLSMSKNSCVINDLINGTTNPKRIPGATVRYSVELNNTGGLAADNVLLSDTLSSEFSSASVKNLQIQDGACDCLGVSSASNNGINGSANGVSPIVLDFNTIGAGSTTIPTQKCGYFEVDLL